MRREGTVAGTMIGERGERKRGLEESVNAILAVVEWEMSLDDENR